MLDGPDVVVVVGAGDLLGLGEGGEAGHADPGGAELEAGRASEAVQGLKAGLGLSSGESVPLAKASELDKLQGRCLPPIRP